MTTHHGDMDIRAAEPPRSLDEALHRITCVETPIERAALTEKGRRIAKVTAIVVSLLVFATGAAAAVPFVISEVKSRMSGDESRGSPGREIGNPPPPTPPVSPTFKQQRSQK